MVFGWLKKRQLNEHRKLIYQNHSACTYLEAFFQGEVAAATQLAAFRDEIEAAARARGAGPMDAETALRMIEINRVLRRLWDHGPKLQPFDAQFVPAGGWQVFYAYQANIGQ